jgi:hypothetical protein
METYNISVPYDGQVEDVKLDFFDEDADPAVVAHVGGEHILFLSNDNNQLEPVSEVKDVDPRLINEISTRLSRGRI